MSIIEKVVDRAIRKGWAPAQDKQAILTKISKIGQKHGFTPDDFGIASCTESYGLNPRADNKPESQSGCTGIIQFCSNSKTPGVKTIGKKNYRLKEIKKLSILQQLDLADAYYTGLITPKMRENMPGVRLYFFILLPVVAARFNNLDPNVNLKTQIPQHAGLMNGQAARFYVNNKQNGVMTINSVKRGLEVFAAELLGEPITFGPGGSSLNSGSTISGTGGQGLNNPFGITTGIITGKCADIFPIEFTLKESITYKGCVGKITPSVMGGNSLAYPAQGMRINSAGNITLADYDSSVSISPGSLGKPLNSPNMTLTGNSGVYGAKRNRNGKVYWHSGQDYGVRGGSLGTEVLAVADGVVVNNKLVSGYGPGTLEVVSKQLGNLFVRYGHVTPSVQIGQEVKKGQVIGKIPLYPGGHPHLHLELRKDKGKGGSAWSEAQLRSETINPALYCRRK